MTNIFISSTRGAQFFQVLFLLGSIAGLFFLNVSIDTLLLVAIGYFLYGCLGIVVTFHRNLTHRSYNTHKLITRLLSVLGCLAATGSPLAWIAIHINHHLRSDKPDDPHSPRYKGIKIFTLSYDNEISPNTKWRMRRIVSDKFQQFLHRYYFVIIISYSLLLYAIGGLYLMIFLHWAPAALTGIMSNVVNYIGHKPNWIGGYRLFKLNDDSTNNWIWAIPSWGESWHNNHHRYPTKFNFSEKWWEIDISGLIIKIIKTNK